MKPTTFPQQTHVLAEDQPEYQPLPVFITPDRMEVVSCWSVGLMDRLTILFTGRVWLRTLTFGELFQPQRLQVKAPFFVHRKKTMLADPLCAI